MNKKLLSFMLVSWSGSYLFCAPAMPRTRLSDLQVSFNQIIKRPNLDRQDEQAACKILTEIASDPIYNDRVNKIPIKEWVNNAIIRLSEKLNRPPVCALELERKGLILPAVARTPAPELNIPVADQLTMSSETATPTKTYAPSAPTLSEAPIAIEKMEHAQISAGERGILKPGELPAEEIRRENIQPIIEKAEIQFPKPKAPSRIAPKPIKIEHMEAAQIPAGEKGNLVPETTQAIERRKTEEPATGYALIRQLEKESPSQGLTDIIQSLHYLEQMSKESNDIPKMAEKYGLMQNGVVDIDALVTELENTKKSLLDAAAQQPRKIQDTIQDTTKLLMLQILDNIAAYKKSQVSPEMRIPEAPAFIPEAPLLEEKPQEIESKRKAQPIKPTKPASPEKPTMPSSQEFQEGKKKLKPVAQEKDKATMQAIAKLKEQKDTNALKKYAQSLDQDMQEKIVKFYIDKGPLRSLPPEDKKILETLLSNKKNPGFNEIKWLAELRNKEDLIPSMQEKEESKDGDWSTD